MLCSTANIASLTPDQEECHLYHFRLIFLDHLPQLPNWGSYSIALYLHLKGVSRKALECADISGVERRVLNSLKVEGGHALVECGKRDAKTGMITDQFCIVFDAGDVNIPIPSQLFPCKTPQQRTLHLLLGIMTFSIFFLPFCTLSLSFIHLTNGSHSLSTHISIFSSTF